MERKLVVSLGGKELHRENNAHINISEGDCPERILALVRSTSAIWKAFAVITENLKEDSHSVTSGPIDSSQPEAQLSASEFEFHELPFSKHLVGCIIWGPVIKIQRDVSNI